MQWEFSRIYFPPQNEEAYFQIFLKFPGDRILYQKYDFGRRGGQGEIIFQGDIHTNSPHTEAHGHP